MMKNLSSDYSPGRRVGNMVKMKQKKGIWSGYNRREYGKGKRSGCFQVYIILQKRRKFLEIGKVGTGIKEKKEEGISFDELTKKLKPLITEEKGKDVKISQK